MLGWLRKRKRDSINAPFHWVGEVVRDGMYVSPPLESPQGRAVARLGMRLGSAFDLGEGGPGGWVILYEPELHLGKNDVGAPAEARPALGAVKPLLEAVGPPNRAQPALHSLPLLPV